MSDVPVSIILRSFNEAWALRETLPALRAQQHRNWELIVIDSGSHDGSVDLIRQAAPRHFLAIAAHDYQPGRVLNTGMRLARHDTVIFLNADATPQGPDWLGPLVAALQHPQTAAVFSCQRPRPDCRAVFACDYERCFGANRESANWDNFFSMVSSGIRRDVWTRRGFLESLQYSEDDEYTRWCRREGHRVLYCPDSVVMHSHNYAPRQAYKRSFGEAWALRTIEEGHGLISPPARLRGWLNDVQRDLSFCLRMHRLPEWPHSWRVRWAQRRGQRDGYRVGSAIESGKLLA